MDYFRTKITEVERLGKEYALLRFSGNTPVSGEPGQFVMVRGDWGTDPVLPRAFSIVEVGEHGSILVRVVGKGTELLAGMRRDESLWVLGPIGRAYPAPEVGTRSVLVAGGVGVAPLLFLAERLPQDPKPICIYGARTSHDLPLSDRLEKRAELIVTTEDGSVGEKGLVTEPLERLLDGDEKLHIFSCGPTPMLEAVGKMAMNKGTSCHISLESPMACGVGTCKGCAVKAPDGEYVYVCSDGPVFEAAEVFSKNDGGKR